MKENKDQDELYGLIAAIIIVTLLTYVIYNFDSVYNNLEIIKNEFTRKL